MAGERPWGLGAARIAGLVAVLLLLAMVAAIGTAAIALPGCQSCHFGGAGFAAATAATAHARAKTSCVDCHVQADDVLQRTKFGLYEAFGMWVPLLDPAATDATVVRDMRCLSCHQDVLKTTVTVSGLRVAHAACAAKNRCVDCHSEVGHGTSTPWPRAASMNGCVDCHKEMKVSLKCDTCHVGRMLTDSASMSEFGATHSATWKQTHGMGQMSSCSVCHEEGSCSGCHGPGVPHPAEFVGSHAKVSGQPKAACGSCHAKDFCFDCHQTEMPHPAQFAAGHSIQVARDGEKPCLRCHVKADCDTCHISHVHPGGAVGAVPSPRTGPTQ